MGIVVLLVLSIGVDKVVIVGVVCYFIIKMYVVII